MITFPQVFSGVFQRFADLLDRFGLIDGLDWAITTGRIAGCSSRFIGLTVYGPVIEGSDYT